MAAAQHTIQIDGKLVGHAISLDARYVFYAASNQLGHLDERRFNSVEEIRLAISRALDTTPSATARLSCDARSRAVAGADTG